MYEIPTPPRCLVKGHKHAVIHVARRVQDGTGAVAHTWECPGGRYRWFALEGKELNDHMRSTRPRFGWAKTQ